MIQDVSKLSKYARDVLAWLGFWRDKMPNEAVESLQGIIESNETDNGYLEDVRVFINGELQKRFIADNGKIYTQANFVPRNFRINIETVKGPWVSLGVHLDFQAPKIDIHFGWWIISIGWLYMSDIRVEYGKPNE